MVDNSRVARADVVVVVVVPTTVRLRCCCGVEVVQALEVLDVRNRARIRLGIRIDPDWSRLSHKVRPHMVQRLVRVVQVLGSSVFAIEVCRTKSRDVRQDESWVVRDCIALADCGSGLEEKWHQGD